MQPEMAKRAENIAKVAAKSKTQTEEVTPKGTLAILLGYAVLMVVLWGAIYVTMLLRG